MTRRLARSATVVGAPFWPWIITFSIFYFLFSIFHFLFSIFYFLFSIFHFLFVIDLRFMRPILQGNSGMTNVK